MADEDDPAQLHKALEALEAGYDQTLCALSAALDVRAQETPGHSERVAAYTLELAAAMGITDAPLLTQIRRGAVLHDVGKIAIPESILRKPGPLNAEEWRLMRRHPEIGYHILQGIPMLQEAAQIPLCHHERWDGSGYPRGLRGAEIPLPARLFAIADWLDAITSDRAYRQAETFEKARAVIAEASGSQFDPEAVSAFLSVPLGRWQEIRRHTQSTSTLLEAFTGGGFRRRTPRGVEMLFPD
ncbi:MAG: HD-GYP domain-containing protein [Bacillota bacterium]